MYVYFLLGGVFITAINWDLLLGDVSEACIAVSEACIAVSSSSVVANLTTALEAKPVNASHCAIEAWQESNVAQTCKEVTWTLHFFVFLWASFDCYSVPRT